MPHTTYLDNEDHPYSVGVLKMAVRGLNRAAVARLGLRFTSHGAHIDWDAVTNERSWLWTSTKGFVQIARQLADIERERAVAATAIYLGLATPAGSEHDESARD
jgi:hypothetical protein